MAVLDEIIRKLEAARGDVRAQAVITADFALAMQPETGREGLRAALDAAAVLRCFDVPLLARMLAVSNAEAGVRFASLARLPFVERFPSRAGDVRNVHEATRLGWRCRLAKDQPKDWRAWSARAAAWFEQDARPSGRIEWIYHLLSADPDAGAIALEKLDRDWAGTARPENRQALALVLGELEGCGLVAGKARVEVLLCTAEVRSSRGETARLGATARAALEVALALKYQPGLARAYGLSGDVYQALGRLEEAQIAFAENLAISLRLAEQYPSDTGRQSDLGVAHHRVAGILEEQGKLDSALIAFTESLAIIRGLAEQDPTNAGWQRNLAGAYNGTGRILEAQGKLEAAQAAFAESLAIIRRLAEQDPTNAGWQRDLAAAHNATGRVLEAQDKLEAAQTAFAEDLAISRRLADQDPSNARWQRDLAAAYNRNGLIRSALGQERRALAAFREHATIMRRLVDSDATSADWRHGLAVALWCCGFSAGSLGQKQSALSFYLEAKRIFDHLVQTAPGFVKWQNDREHVSQQLADLQAELEAAGDGPE